MPEKRDSVPTMRPYHGYSINSSAGRTPGRPITKSHTHTQAPGGSRTGGRHAGDRPYIEGVMENWNSFR